MDEEENQVIDPKSPIGKDPFEELNSIFNDVVVKNRPTLDSQAAGKQYNLPGFGDSQYDDQIKIDAQLELNDLYYKSLEQNRALNQPKIDKLGNALGRLTNIIPEAIGGMAAVLDFEDYFNSNDEVGNWLTDLTNEWKENTNEALPIYRTDRDTPMDFGDSGWWFENGSSLVQSIGGFAITGGAVAKGLQGLSKVAKLKTIGTAMAGANVANKAGQVGQTLGTAVGLNQAEAILEATEVYDEIYKNTLAKIEATENLSAEQAEAKARQKAADAASVTVQTNRLNIFLNITSASLFTAAPRMTRQLLKKQTTAKNLGYGILEGGQESAEEVINFIASQRGKAFGNDKEYTMKDVYADVLSDESKEAALLGFMGGIGQTIITKEGVNRINKTIDPETGDKISVRKYNKLAYERQKEQLDELEAAFQSEDVKSFTDIYNSVEKQAIINKQLEDAIKNGDDDKVKVLQKLSLDTQALNAFKSGTTEPLIKLYEDLANGPQKKGMDKDYAQKARKAIERIESLENIYNKVANEVNAGQLYHNRSLVDNYENEIDRKVNILNEKKSELAKQENRLLEYTTDEDIRKKHRLYMRNINPLRSEIRDIESSIDSDSEMINFLNEQYKVLDSKKYKKQYQAKKESEAEEVQEELDNISEEVEEAYEKEQEEILNQEGAKETRETVIKEKEEAKEEDDAKRTSNNAYKALETLINDPDNYGFESLPNSPGVIFKGGSDQHLELINSIPGFESFDSDTPVQIRPTAEGIEVSFKGEEGYRENVIIQEYNLVNEDDTATTQEVNDSVTDVNNNDTQLNSDDNQVISKEVTDAEKTKINIAKDASLVESEDPLLSSPNYKEYRENPINKVGQEVTFTIGNAGDSEQASNAISTLRTAITSGVSLSTVALKKVIRQIPIKVNFNEDTFTHLSFESEITSVTLKDAEYKIKENIISQVLANGSFDGITSKVAFQYPGIVKQDVVEGKPASNSVLDLEYINNELSNIEYFISDSIGNILSLDNQPNPSFGRSKFPGNIFVKVKTANGKDFPLKLNIRRLNEAESDIILVLTEALLNPAKKLKYKDIIGNKQEEIAFTEEQLELVKKEAKILGKSMKNLTIIDLLSSMVYEGSSDKNKFKISGTTLTYGNNIISYEDFAQSRNIIKNWLGNNKNRNVKKAKLREKAYKEYFTKNVLSTDAKLGENIFGGNTKMYISTDITIPKDSKKVIEVPNTDNEGNVSAGSASIFNDLLSTTPSDSSESDIDIKNKNLIQKRINDINKLKKEDNLLAYHYLRSKIGINNAYGSDTTLITKELGLSYKEAKKLVERRLSLIKPKNYKLGDKYDTTELDNKINDILNNTSKTVESIPNPVVRKKAKGKIKGGLKARLKAKKNANNSDVNDIPSTDDKNKKC